MKSDELENLNNILLDNLPCAAMVIKKGTREIVVSNAHARSLGAIPGKTCYEVIAKGKEPCPFCLASELWETGESRQLDAIKFGDNYYEVRWVPYNEDLYIHYITDITAHKQTEERLKQSEARFLDLYYSAPVAYFSVGTDGIIRAVNKATESFTGYSSEELIKMHVSDIYAEESIAKASEITESLFSQGIAVSNEEMVYQRKDGQKVYGLLSVTPIKDEVGRVSGGRSVVVDITERKQIEELYITLARNSPIGVYIFQDGKYRFVNHQFAQATGYSEEELVNMEPGQLVHHEDREKARDAATRMLKGERTSPYEFRVYNRDGEIRWAMETVSSIYYEGKRATLGNFMDITERKRAEEERSKMEEQLILTDRLASIGELSAGIAHEINNPLTGVIGFSELLMDREDVPDDIKEDLKIINSEAKRTSEIARHLLTFARKQDVQQIESNINDIIQTILDLRGYEQRVSNIQIHTSFSPDVPEIIADPSRLQQVFFNIIINAEFFMKEAHGRGDLTITTERAGDIIKASFADNGPGIASENLSRLFDPFFTTKEVGKGTGLGLSICYGIVAEHGGRLYAESELGRGTTFVVELPIRRIEEKEVKQDEQIGR
jgi:two-component system NtrC family sensor kinase